MDVSVLKTLQLAMVMIGVAAMRPLDGKPLSWTCDDTTTVHDTGTLLQVLREWYVWDVWDLHYSGYSSNVLCAKVSVRLSDESSGNYDISLVNVTVYMDQETGPKFEPSFTGYFVNGKPGEIFDPGSHTVYRVNSVSPDGHILVIAACMYGDYKLWMMLGDKENSFPRSVPRLPYTMYRRDPEVCLRLTSSLHGDYDYEGSSED